MRTSVQPTVSVRETRVIVMHDSGLYWTVFSVSNARCQTIDAEEAFVAFTGNERSLPHPIWSGFIQVRPCLWYCVVQNSHPKINSQTTWNASADLMHSDRAVSPCEARHACSLKMAPSGGLTYLLKVSEVRMKSRPVGLAGLFGRNSSADTWSIPQCSPPVLMSNEHI